MMICVSSIKQAMANVSIDEQLPHLVSGMHILNNTNCSLEKFSTFEQSQKLQLSSMDVIAPYSNAYICFNDYEDNSRALFNLVYKVICQGIENTYFNLVVGHDIFSAEIGSINKVYLSTHTDWVGKQLKNIMISDNSTIELKNYPQNVMEMLDYISGNLGMKT